MLDTKVDRSDADWVVVCDLSELVLLLISEVVRRLVCSESVPSVL